MTLSKTLIAFAAVLGAASLAAAETRTIDRTLPLASGGVVALTAHNGRIQIHTWDRPEVRVHVQIDSWAGPTDLFRAATVDVEGSPGRVSIRWKRPDESVGLWSWLFGNAGWLDVRYDITAPVTARWDIRTHNAEADMRDVRGAVRLATHNGLVRIDRLTGPLDLDMHNGRARIDFAAFTNDSRITTHNGMAEVAVPAATGFDLHSSVFHGRVESDFPTSRALGYGWHGPREANASINGGGPELRLSSHNGGFRIRSKP